MQGRRCCAAREQALHDGATRPTPPAVNLLCEPGDGRAFLLAAADEAALMRRFRLQAVAGIGSFVAAAAALAWLLGFAPR